VVLLPEESLMDRTNILSQIVQICNAIADLYKQGIERINRKAPLYQVWKALMCASL
jgi:hypothetical protein